MQANPPVFIAVPVPIHWSLVAPVSMNAVTLSAWVSAEKKRRETMYQIPRRHRGASIISYLLVLSVLGTALLPDGGRSNLPTSAARLGSPAHHSQSTPSSPT